MQMAICPNDSEVNFSQGIMLLFGGSPPENLGPVPIMGQFWINNGSIPVLFQRLIIIRAFI